MYLRSKWEKNLPVVCCYNIEAAMKGYFVTKSMFPKKVTDEGPHALGGVSMLHLVEKNVE